MRRILVPTDFSDTARNAFRAALEIAPQFGAEVELIHVYTSPTLGASGFGVTLPGGMHENILGWLADFAREEGVENVRSQALQGIAEEKLVALSNEPDVVMIIMGSTGKQHSGKKWFGSVSESVSRNAQCPVLLIPTSWEDGGFQQILFAADMDTFDESTLTLLTDWAGVFRSSLHFVHVEDPDHPVSFQTIEQRILEFLFRKGEPGFAFQISCIHSESIEEGLWDYAEQNQVDMMAMCTRRRGALESLLHKSQTKALALYARIPLMILHQGD